MSTDIPVPSEVRNATSPETLRLIRGTTGGGGAVYRMQDGNFLKTGPSDSEAGGMQQRMHDLGMPVPMILDIGTELVTASFPEKYIILKDMGPTFETVDGPDSPLSVAQGDYVQIAECIRRWFIAQAENQVESSENPIDSIYVDELLSDMLEVLPEAVARERIQLLESIVPKLEGRLSSLPRVYNHGDFVPRNMTRDGVIDLEYAHIGVLGYDAASAMFHPFMFPRPSEGDLHEASRTYEFSLDQVFDLIDTLNKEGRQRGLDMAGYLDDLIIAKMIWSSGGTGSKPNLQQWRMNMLEKCLRAYKTDECLAVVNLLYTPEEN